MLKDADASAGDARLDGGDEAAVPAKLSELARCGCWCC